MKAKLSRTTASAALTAAQRAAVEAYLEAQWKAKQRLIMRRLRLAVCLALNDLYRFGDKRLMIILQAIDDISADYAEQAFSVGDARNGTMVNGDYDPMAELMQAELLDRRKIHVKVNESGWGT